jgi:hypothetical protein
MIPKIIHYCWFGGNPLPELAQKCIESWKKYCPDYEIREWNETNFDLNCNQYVKEAFEAKKWAFITDYVRLWAMVRDGGIYMDTDVEIIRPLDIYLKERAFSGFETEDSIPTGIMACEEGFPLFKELLTEYRNRSFIKSDGTYDLTTNVTAITNYCLRYGLVLNNTKQTIQGFTLYPHDVFCPKSHKTGIITCTENTHTIHHFAGSWHTEKELKWINAERKLRDKFGYGLADCIFLRLIRNIYCYGLWSAIVKIKDKIIYK